MVKDSKKLSSVKIFPFFCLGPRPNVHCTMCNVQCAMCNVLAWPQMECWTKKWLPEPSPLSPSVAFSLLKISEQILIHGTASCQEARTDITQLHMCLNFLTGTSLLALFAGVP